MKTPNELKIEGHFGTLECEIKALIQKRMNLCRSDVWKTEPVLFTCEEGQYFEFGKKRYWVSKVEDNGNK